MKRLFITLFVSALTLSASAQSITPSRLFKKRPTPTELENFHQMLDLSLQQARATQPHDSVSFDQWNNGSWTTTQHSKIVRNAQQQIVEVVNYDPQVSPTQPVSKFEMTYVQDKVFRQRWLTPRNGSWHQEMELEYRYDSRGNLTASTYSMWDINGNLQLFVGDSLEYSYQNQQITTIGYGMGFSMGSSIEWVPVMLVDNINYDSQGKPTSFVQAEYDVQIGNWLPATKIDNVKWGFGFTEWSNLFVSILALDLGLDPFIPGPLPAQEPTDYIATNLAGTPLNRSSAFVQNNLVNAIKFEVYDSVLGWVPAYEVTYAYNAQNKITAEVYASFDAQTGRFVAEERQLNNYQQAYFTGYTLEVYQNSQWTILGGRSYNYSFDTYSRVTEIVGQSYDPANGSWYNLERITYYYPALSAGVGRLAMEEVSVFPNPTADLVNIQLKSNKSIDRVVVRNMQGQEIYSADFGKEQSSQHSIDLSNLPAAMYFVQIQSGSETGVARVIKR